MFETVRNDVLVVAPWEEQQPKRLSCKGPTTSLGKPIREGSIPGKHVLHQPRLCEPGKSLFRPPSLASFFVSAFWDFAEGRIGSYSG
jgi:hypothetical protein